MTSEQLFLQLIAIAMLDYGVDLSFSVTPDHDPAVWEALAQRQRSAQAEALDAIAAALRADTGDFDCIDEIIRILEPPGLHHGPPPRLRLKTPQAKPAAFSCLLPHTSAAMSHTSPMPPAPISV